MSTVTETSVPPAIDANVEIYCVGKERYVKISDCLEAHIIENGKGRRRILALWKDPESDKTYKLCRFINKPAESAAAAAVPAPSPVAAEPVPAVVAAAATPEVVGNLVGKKRGRTPKQVLAAADSTPKKTPSPKAKRPRLAAAAAAAAAATDPSVSVTEQLLHSAPTTLDTEMVEQLLRSVDAATSS